MPELDLPTTARLRQAFWQYSAPGPHAIFTLGGWHADGYFNSDIISQDPSLLREVCANYFLLALRSRDIHPKWVLTYPPYGLPFAYELASQLGCRFGYISSLAEPELHFQIAPSEKVLVVADDIFSGNSMRTTTGFLVSRGLTIEPVRMCLGNFSGSDTFDGVEVLSSFSGSINLWKPEECPLCKLGSRAVRARALWSEMVKSL